MPRAAPPPRPSTRSPPARSSRTTPRGNRKPPPPALPTAIRASVPLPLVSAQLVLSSRRGHAPTHEYLRRSYHSRRSRRVGTRVAAYRRDRQSAGEGEGVSARVDRGGGRIIKKTML